MTIKKGIIIAGYLLLGVWSLGAIGLAGGVVSKALGQEMHHNHPPQDAGIHNDFYEKWLRPNTRLEDGKRDPTRNCCNKEDCYPTEVKKIGPKQYAALHRETGDWVTIPDNVLEQNYMDGRYGLFDYEDGVESPDGRSHACITKYKHVYCVTLGAGT
jgi:hypothetical protein